MKSNTYLGQVHLLSVHLSVSVTISLSLFLSNNLSLSFNSFIFYISLSVSFSLSFYLFFNCFLTTPCLSMGISVTIIDEILPRWQNYNSLWDILGFFGWYMANFLLTLAIFMPLGKFSLM